MQPRFGFFSVQLGGHAEDHRGAGPGFMCARSGLDSAERGLALAEQSKFEFADLEVEVQRKVRRADSLPLQRNHGAPQSDDFE
jgi:hypothetical protein